MRKTINVTVLILVLTIPVFAGDIGMPVAPPRESGCPKNALSSIEPAKTGEIGNPLTTSDVARTLLQTLLGLF